MRGFKTRISKQTYAPQTFVVRLSIVELGNQFDDVVYVTQDGGQIVVGAVAKNYLVLNRRVFRSGKASDAYY